MHSGSRLAWRDRMRRSGLAPVAAQLAAPVVLGLLIGGVLAYQAGSSNNAIQPVPLGAIPTPTTSFVRPTAVPTGAVPVPTPSFARPSATSATPVATTTASGN
jgi:hypothetical protein